MASIVRSQLRFLSSTTNKLVFHFNRREAPCLLKGSNKSLLLRRCLATSATFKDNNEHRNNGETSSEPSFSYDTMLINRANEGFTNNEDSLENASSSEPVSKAVLLNRALLYVDEFGWSVDAIREASKQLGLSTNVETMFERGGGDIVLHFIGECNAQLSNHLQSIKRSDINSSKSKDTSEFLKDAIETRLRMVIPHIKSWPSAMTLMLHPQNATEAIEYAANMVDEIWYHAGDTSTDIDWYTKRIGLGAIYGATELYMMTDKSTDFKDTWKFLGDRLDNVQQLNNLQGMLNDTCSKTYNGISTAFSTARNLTRQ